MVKRGFDNENNLTTIFSCKPSPSFTNTLKRTALNYTPKFAGGLKKGDGKQTAVCGWKQTAIFPLGSPLYGSSFMGHRFSKGNLV